MPQGRPKGSRNRPKVQRDQVVEEPLSNSIIEFTANSTEIIPDNSDAIALYTEQLRTDILEMYEAGIPVRQIAQKFPLYTPEQILELCHSQFDISQYGSENLDAIILKNFLGTVSSIKKFTKDNEDDPHLTLAALNVLSAAIDRTAKFRLSILPMIPTNPDLNSKATAIETMEEKIKAKIRSLPTLEERQAWLRKIESSNAEELEQLLEGDWKPVLPKTNQNNTTILEGEFRSTDSIAAEQQLPNSNSEPQPRTVLEIIKSPEPEVQGEISDAN